MSAFVRNRPQQPQQELELGQVFARQRLTLSALRRKQHAPWLCRDFLSRCCNSVHVTQAISQYFHHVRGKMRRLLNEKMEPPSIDFRQPTGGLCDCAGCARVIIDQRHFTNQRSWSCGLEHKIAKHDLHFPFQQHVHLLAFVALAEESIAGREFQGVGVLTKKFGRIHGWNVSATETTKEGRLLPSYNCVTAGPAALPRKFFVSFMGFVVNFHGSR